MFRFHRLHRLIAPIVLLLFVGVSYHAAPNNGFHLDDEINIVRHPPILITDLTLENLVYAGENAHLPLRPLPSMTFAFDWWRGGGSPRSFQYTNILIHGATALAVYGLFILVLGRFHWSPWALRVAALFGAALWACHPIQVQGVTYIVQRMASMATLFTILTLVFYILARSSGTNKVRWACFILSGFSWILGLASKETAAIAPLLVLLTEYGVLRQGKPLFRSWVDWVYLSLPVVLTIFVVIDLASGYGPLSERFVPGYEYREFSLLERLLTQPRVIAFHLSQYLLPLPDRFSLEHDFVLSKGLLQPASTLVALLGLFFWCSLGLRALLATRWRVAGFFLLWVPATLAIESSFISLEIIFEHRMYQPSVGLAGLVALGVGWGMTHRASWHPAILTVSLLMVGMCALSTAVRVPQWKSDSSLMEVAVVHAPNSARVWTSLAKARRDMGQSWEQVMPALQKALALDPNYPVALHMYAIYLVEQRKLSEAEAVLERLVPLSNRDHSFLNTLGMVRIERGNYFGAIEALEQAISLNPTVSEFRYNLALAYELALMCREAHARWLSYLQNVVNENSKAAVQARLRRNFDMEGGRCFGWDQRKVQN